MASPTKYDSSTFMDKKLSASKTEQQLQVMHNIDPLSA